MSAQAPPTGRKLLKDLRRAGVNLTANGDRLAFDAPSGVVTGAVLAILKAHKPEILAVLRGDYLHAALALLLGIADAVQRNDLAESFDEQAGICEYSGNMDRGEAERQAYIELSRKVEWVGRGCPCDT